MDDTYSMKANEHLFDLKNKDYKNTKKKEATWAEIANVLNLTTEDVKKHWKNLRDRFLREKRDKPSGAGVSDTCWHLFHKMLFYSHYSRQRKTITATPEMEGLNTPRSLSSSSSNRPSSSLWDDDIVMSPEEHVVSENLDEDEVAVEEISTPKAKTITTPRANKRKRPDGEFSEILDLAKRLTASLENKPQQTDSNRTFVEYMYSCLSEMTVEEAKNKRKAILRILD
ncbi:hypothetical protein NQ314_013620 [Rhamnusium bicolor]|uniref:Transcription factor Adf-1 n=1 Tax=Rhamnusium bicolor TaxID=1586634 RepID=A0AAV8X551_9CUCU|nr:hypothetical protein NQ314_013620 [Rhamnusium bicolor]